MRLPHVWLASVAVLAALLAGCSMAGKEEKHVEVKSSSDRKQAPSFSLKDADGRAVALADYKGKVVLLNFWATWCGPCKIEIPWFADFEQKYKDQGFAVVGVSMDEEGWKIVKPYVTQAKINYRVLLGDDATAQMYGGVESLPTTYMIDQDGKIASTHIGLVSKSVYEDEIKSLLSGSTHRSASAASVVAN